MKQKKDEGLISDMRQTLDIAIKLKAVMQKKRLRIAKCVCPRCDGWIYGSLNGKRDHLHMACKGVCKIVYME